MTIRPLPENNVPIGAVIFFGFNAWQRLHSMLWGRCHNTETEFKDKSINIFFDSNSLKNGEQGLVE